MITVLLAALYGSCVGLALGLTGGGGSIVAVPLLVYGLHFEFRQAVALSLAIVGLTALYGALLQRARGHVAWSHGITLGIGGIFAVPLGVRIGEHLSDRASLLLFALLMMYIAGRMLLSRRHLRAPAWLRCGEPGQINSLCPSCIVKLLVAGGITGILSGLFGVGGGFLLIPTLMAVAQLSIEYAMATSLVSIVIISATGLVSNANQLTSVSLIIPTIFLVGSGLGMQLGIRVKKSCSPERLQLIFGIAVVAMAVFVLFKNIK